MVFPKKGVFGSYSVSEGGGTSSGAEFLSLDSDLTRANRLSGTLKLWLTLEFLVDRMDGISGDSSGSSADDVDPVDEAPVDPPDLAAAAEAPEDCAGLNSPGSPIGVVGVVAVSARLDGGGGAGMTKKPQTS